MLQTLNRKIPRPLVLLTRYMYPALGLMALLIAVMLFGTDGWTAGEIIAVLALAIVGIVTWWVLKFRPSADLPHGAEQLATTLHGKQQYTLLAFESEYCPICSAADVHVRRLEAMNEPSLSVLRLSIQREPGSTLFRQHDGRMTPAYVLLDPRGRPVQDWLIALPIERVLFAVRSGQ